MPSVQAETVPGLFLGRVSATPDLAAYQYPEHGTWRTLTWRQMGDLVRTWSNGLRALGLQNEERCALLSGTRWDWIAADFAILCAGGATTTIYPSNTAEECAFILQDSEAAFVFAENEAQLQKLQAHRTSLPRLRHVILLDGDGSADGWVLSLAQLAERGRALEEKNPRQFEAVARGVRKDGLATLIYTSGTTGKPKGVELTHDCWVYEAEAIDALGLLNSADVQLLWLPLAHSFGKVLEMAQLRIGFLTAVDGRVEKLVENLAAVRPTFVAAVPRIFEKVHNKVVAGAKQGSPLKARIFEWAVRVGRQVSAREQQGKGLPLRLMIERAAADKLVFSKMRERFGGRLRFFVSGSAPLARELAEFFHAMGILILEGYGLTESSAASFVNIPTHFGFGTVGVPLPGTEVRISPEDGEILFRNRGLMRGYHHLPGETSETLDAHGFLHTGDIGTFDNGLLKITDRKKDLIKTSGGKYVAPQLFEGKLKASCPYVSQVLVHGNNRNFCTALIALDEESLVKWAKDHGLGPTGYSELTRHPRVVALIQEHVDAINAGLANYERVGKFALLPVDLTLEAGDLTASLKVKRKVVEQKYKALLDGFYAGAVSKA